MTIEWYHTASYEYYRIKRNSQPSQLVHGQSYNEAPRRNRGNRYHPLVQAWLERRQRGEISSSGRQERSAKDGRGSNEGGILHARYRHERIRHFVYQGAEGKDRKARYGLSSDLEGGYEQ